jgi:hypothetical protein
MDKFGCKPMAGYSVPGSNGRFVFCSELKMRPAIIEKGL